MGMPGLRIRMQSALSLHALEGEVEVPAPFLLHSGHVAAMGFIDAHEAAEGRTRPSRPDMFEVLDANEHDTKAPVSDSSEVVPMN